MTRIKVRNPGGKEYSFVTKIEFLHALEGGRITAAWEIYHQSCGRWLPIMLHPAFQASADPVPLGDFTDADMDTPIHQGAA